MSDSQLEKFFSLDAEIRQEFYEDVSLAVNDINDCVSELASGADSSLIARLFRALHTLKGNCNMVFLDSFVAVSHKLEDLFSKLRSGEIAYDHIYGNFAVSAVNTIKEQLDSLVNQQQFDDNILLQLARVIDEIECSNEDQRLQMTGKAITAVEDGHFNLAMVAMGQDDGEAFSFKDATDAEFFHFLIAQQSKFNPLQGQFFSICEPMAKQLNSMLSRSIDEPQLMAAVIYISLSNAMAISEHCEKISMEQIFFASGLLSRMAGWGVAAETVLQLNENYDGSGLPYGLSGEQIASGAQSFALSVDFTLAVIKHRKQGYKNALFAAVKKINALKDTRFKPRLVERFNQIIKTEYLNKQRW